MTRSTHINNTRDKTRDGKPSLTSIINRDILRRAGVVALVLGSTLTLANQFEAIVGPGDIRILPMVLNYMTPFVVVAISQVLGIRQAIINKARQKARSLSRGSFLKTAIAHGIPARAALVGLTAGGLTSAIASAGAFIQYGNLDTVQLAVFAQAFSLPILFGMLSQAIAYRRAAATGV